MGCRFQSGTPYQDHLMSSHQSRLKLLTLASTTLTLQWGQVSGMTILKWASLCPSPTALHMWQWGTNSLHINAFLFPVYMWTHGNETWIVKGILSITAVCERDFFFKLWTHCWCVINFSSLCIAKVCFVMTDCLFLYLLRLPLTLSVTSPCATL